MIIKRPLRDACLLILLCACTAAPSNAQAPEVPSNSCQDGILITDFESGGLETNHKGTVQTWKRDVPGVELAVVESGIKGNKYAGQLTIEGNDGEGNDDWTGAGFAIALTSAKEGLDVSDCTHLQFDVRIQPGSSLQQLQIKLEDTTTINGNRPKRLITDYGHTLSTDWQTAEIPLKAFKRKKGNDPGEWRSLKNTNVTVITTISTHDEEVKNGDGVLLIDNIRFVAK